MPQLSVGGVTASGTLSRRTVLAGLLGSAAVLAGPTPRALAAEVASDVPGPDGPVARAGGRTLEMDLYVVALPNNQLGYGLTPETASVPGPTIEMVEGDTIHINVHNTLTVEASLHVHGVNYTIDNDGTQTSNSTVPPGGSRVYTWTSHGPGEEEDGTIRRGSAGFWHYHDHIVGTTHGTGGIARGLYGALIVRREGDLLPQKQNVTFFTDTGINNRSRAAAPKFTAFQGQRVEWVVVGHGNLFHSFGLHGHQWVESRTGVPTPADSNTRVIDSSQVGPADSFGFQVIAGEGSGPGVWPYLCQVPLHANAGHTGTFTVLEPVKVTGVEDGGVYGDSQDKTIAWTVNVEGATVTATLDGKAISSGTTIPLWTLPLGQHELVITVSSPEVGTATSTVSFTTKTSFADIEALIARFRGQNRLAGHVADSLLDRLRRAADRAAAGSEKSAISFLEQFVSRAKNQIKGDAQDLEVRALMVRDGEALIAELRAADEAEGF